MLQPVYPRLLERQTQEISHHCMDRIAKAVDIQHENVKEATNKGDFHVRSTENKDQWCQFSLGGKDSMPKCTCPDFSRTGLPCKHFFAVFEHNREWKWDALPLKYQDNLFICCR